MRFDDHTGRCGQDCLDVVPELVEMARLPDIATDAC